MNKGYQPIRRLLNLLWRVHCLESSIGLPCSANGKMRVSLRQRFIQSIDFRKVPTNDSDSDADYLRTNGLVGWYKTYNVAPSPFVREGKSRIMPQRSGVNLNKLGHTLVPSNVTRDGIRAMMKDRACFSSSLGSNVRCNAEEIWITAQYQLRMDFLWRTAILDWATRSIEHREKTMRQSDFLTARDIQCLIRTDSVATARSEMGLTQWRWQLKRGVANWNVAKG